MPVHAGPPGHSRIVGTRPLSTRPASPVAGPPVPETTPDLDWMIWSACQYADPELFFAPDGERQLDRTIREAQAKEVCAACPVMGSCASFAAEYPELTKHGVWAGVGDDERESAKRRKRRTQERAAAAKKAKTLNAAVAPQQTPDGLGTRLETAGPPQELLEPVSAVSQSTATPGHHPELVLA